ncbi:MAG TPA: hypothetical protein VEA60_00555 [Allosphingosinicella sp.]|nr:hypothetical protein [Allosphingosinicella sp.]
MGKLKYFAALAALPGLAAAQRAPQDVSAGLESLPIERMCDAEGAIGYKFGATDGPPKIMDMPGVTDMRLNPAFAPFERAGIDSTTWSNRIYAANYVARFADTAAALAAIQTIAARFERLGWSADRGTTDEAAAERTTMSYIAPGAGEVHLYWPAGAAGAGRGDGVRIELTRLGTEVTFSCRSLPVFADHVQEALGRLPDGIPKPSAPILPLPKRPDAALCADPAQRAELFASRPEDSELMRYVVQRTKFRERLVTWKMDRLRKSGKLTDEQMTRLIMVSLDSPAAAKGAKAGLELLGDMLGQLDAVVAAGRAKDETASCGAVVKLVELTEKIGAAVDPQWTAMEAAVDREAARLGIGLE